MDGEMKTIPGTKTNNPKYPQHKALQGAHDFGVLAASQGLAKSQNKYPDYRTGRGCLTWSRSFRRAWAEGWEAYHKFNQESQND